MPRLRAGIGVLMAGSGMLMAALCGGVLLAWLDKTRTSFTLQADRAVDGPSLQQTRAQASLTLLAGPRLPSGKLYTQLTHSVTRFVRAASGKGRGQQAKKASLLHIKTYVQQLRRQKLFAGLTGAMASMIKKLPASQRLEALSGLYPELTRHDARPKNCDQSGRGCFRHCHDVEQVMGREFAEELGCNAAPPARGAPARAARDGDVALAGMAAEETRLGAEEHWQLGVRTPMTTMLWTPVYASKSPTSASGSSAPAAARASAAAATSSAAAGATTAAELPPAPTAVPTEVFLGRIFFCIFFVDIWYMGVHS